MCVCVVLALHAGLTHSWSDTANSSIIISASSPYNMQPWERRDMFVCCPKNEIMAKSHDQLPINPSKTFVIQDFLKRFSHFKALRVTTYLLLWKYQDYSMYVYGALRTALSSKATSWVGTTMSLFALLLESDSAELSICLIFSVALWSKIGNWTSTGE